MLVQWNPNHVILNLSHEDKPTSTHNARKTLAAASRFLDIFYFILSGVPRRTLKHCHPYLFFLDKFAFFHWNFRWPWRGSFLQRACKVKPWTASLIRSQENRFISTALRTKNKLLVKQGGYFGQKIEIPALFLNFYLFIFFCVCVLINVQICDPLSQQDLKSSACFQDRLPLLLLIQDAT